LPAGAALVLDFTPRGLLLAVFFLLLKDKKTMAQKITLGKRPEVVRAHRHLPDAGGRRGLHDRAAGLPHPQRVWRSSTTNCKMKSKPQADSESGAHEEGDRGRVEPFGMSQQDVIARQDAFNVSYLQRTVEGLESRTSRSTRKRSASWPTSCRPPVKAIIAEYRGAINEGRKGN
jgi:hypothetical protein